MRLNLLNNFYKGHRISQMSKMKMKIGFAFQLNNTLTIVR